MLACSVFVMNSIVAYAEGEDVGGESAGTEETLPEDEGTGEGTETPPADEGTGEGTETPPEDEGAGGGTETLPEGDGTENGGEQAPSEDEGTNEGTETPPEDDESKDAEREAWDNLLGALGEFKLGTSLDELKGTLFGFVEKMWSFITSNETYKNIATALVAILAFLVIPVVLGLVVVAYVAGAMVVVVSSALMTVVEVLIKTLMDFGLM